MKPVAVVRQDDQTVVARRGAFCETALERTRGLLPRTSLDPDEALVIPTQSVHTFRMRFPIDVVYVDRRGKVLAVHHRVPRGRILPWRLRASAVVELPAGAAKSAGLMPGQVLKWAPVEPTPRADYNKLAPS